MIEAPLRTHPASGVGWYDREALARLPAAGVELLLVDGPPAARPSSSAAAIRRSASCAHGSRRARS